MGTLKILAGDDDPIIYRILETTLGSGGCQVILAAGASRYTVSSLLVPCIYFFVFLYINNWVKTILPFTGVS